MFHVSNRLPGSVKTAKRFAWSTWPCLEHAPHNSNRIKSSYLDVTSARNKLTAGGATAQIGDGVRCVC